jgi:predicted dinucleotide-binding enzyme
MPKPFHCSRRALLAAGGAWTFAAAFGGSDAFGQAAKQPIGIIGAGNIGGALGALWIKAGHPVMFSSRNPEELGDLVAKLGPLAHAGTVAQAIAFGNVLFVAVPYAALPQIGSDYRDALKGKIVLDATNAVPTRDGDAITKEADGNGIGITSQKYLAGTRLVRAFNITGAGVFTKESNRPDPKMAIPIAGDDAEAVRVAEGLVHDAGFEPVLVGKLADARKFQQRGGPGYGQVGTAAELRQKLGLAP